MSYLIDRMNPNDFITFNSFYQFFLGFNVTSLVTMV